ncbi:hypothetical protein [Nocardioides sp. W7]|uniref:hypothetical protein n=1 Tax=Nocardioides sp. W7 TaxID=2931390 RepID=UPI001FD305F8|nr:hypothetical protein [Nocardioides sp. W7]
MRRWGPAALVAAAAAPALLLLPPSPAAGADCPATATVSVDTATVELGGQLRLSGTGWCHPDGAGSRIGVKLDEGAISRLDTAVHANRTIWAIVDAAPDGTFAASLTLPDGTTATSAPALDTGPHTLRLLSGSLRGGDTVRSALSGTFDVVGAGSGGPPSWAHTTLAAGGATVWVERTVPAGDGGNLRIKGTGWTGGSGASTVAVKLGSSADGGQYRRTGSGVVAHPSASGDDTVWALLAPGGGSHPHVRELATDGSFEVTLDLPDGRVAGQYLTVSLASGRFAAGDTQRSVTTTPLVVGGVPWTGNDGGSDVTCVPTSASPTVALGSTTASFGGSLRITGTGWCNPAGGGSRIGVKLDEGAISRLDGAVHANRTIWAVVEARDSDGTFSADLELPDGTTATSTPALGGGSHTLRLLSGSLANGDTIRSVESAPFVVGSYRPNGVPDPLPAGALRAGTRAGLTARLQGDRLLVRIPAADRGDWVFLSAYAADGSPRYPWGDRWLRAGDGGRLEVSARSAVLTGRLSLVAQAGDLDGYGDLLGWTGVRFPTAGATPPGPTGTTPPTSPSGPSSPLTPTMPTGGSAAGLAPLAPLPQALVAPAPAAPSYVSLGVLPARGATARLDGSLLTLRVPAASPGAVVFVRVYGVAVLTAGFATLDDRSELFVDPARLAPGAYRVTAQAADGTLLGWADATVPEVEPPTTAVEVEASTTPVAAAPAAEDAPWFDSTDGWLLLVGAGLLLGVGLGLTVGGRAPRTRVAA